MPFTRMLVSLRPGPLPFLFMKVLPPRFYILCLALQSFGIHFLPPSGFDHDGLSPHWSPQAFTSSRLTHLGALLSWFAHGAWPFSPIKTPSGHPL